LPVYLADRLHLLFAVAGNEYCITALQFRQRSHLRELPAGHLTDSNFFIWPVYNVVY